MIALLIVLSVLSREQKKLSELVLPLRRYYSSGELSFTVDSKDRIIDKVRRAYRTGTLSEISGLRIDFADWWFVLRAGSTEPKLRLVVMADSEDELESRKVELVFLILNEQIGGRK